ncbi:kininogen-1 isoform X2 [Carcharodon carcharias]|uniref:kininogen-1 isoform X2 n=1 Tax=Carcharodon carcharias TaxID=13397 RepID=UPI001B7DB4B1|nr:kininogen-1 isoform X2 [Carcharodon carcharias]
MCEAEVVFEFGFQIKVPETPLCNLIKPVKRVVETVAVTCEGCPVSVTLDNPLVKASVELAVKAFNDENKKKRTFTLNKIIYAIKEVVIGERYWVHFQIQETECQEDRNEFSSDCPIKAKDEAVLGHCSAEVLFPIGKTKGHLIGLPKCQLFQLIVDEDVDGLSCVGCRLPLKTNDPRVHRTVEHAISKFNDNSGQLYKFALARVLSAEHETSAGEIITLNFTLIETTCLNNNDTAQDMCGPKIPATAEVFRNGTDSLEFQPEKPVTSEPTMKSPVNPTTEHPTEPLAESQNSAELLSLVKEAKPIVPIEITESDLLDE